MITLEDLQRIASRMAVRIEEDHVGWLDGYWLCHDHGCASQFLEGWGIWEDGNFSTSLPEVYEKLQSLAAERGLKW